MKKRIKKTLAAVLAAVMLLTLMPLPALAATTEAIQSVGARSGTTGDCTWTLDDDGTLTISGNGAMRNYYYEYEDDYEGTDVPWRGSLNSIKKVIIEDGVTNIGNYSFYGCTGLTSVSIGDSVTSIGCCAFSHCLNLISVAIPDSVDWIRDNAFEYCSGLKDVIIGKGEKNIEYDVFYGCTDLDSVYITDLAAWCGIYFYDNTSNPLYYAHNLYLNNELVTDLIIPDSVTRIDVSAFSGCSSLTSVTIPDSVTYIDCYAFENCSGLKNVNFIGNAVWGGICEDAFSGCSSLNAVYITDLAAWCGIDFEDNPLNYAHRLFLNNELVTDLIIPDSVTTIHTSVFSGCTSLTSVTIPDSVTRIDGGAFYNCTGLKSITIPESVTQFGNGAFSNLSSDCIINCFNGSYAESYLKSNNLKYSLIDYHYRKLDDGTVELTEYIGNQKNITVPDNILGKAVSSLGNWLFEYNSELETIVLPDSLTNIGKGAFYNCHDLKTVTMGNNVKTIGANAFEKCIYLEQINLGSKLETIGDEAFYDCRRLKALDIPATVKSIGEEAFTNCRSLQSLVIPKGVKKLGDNSSTGFGMFDTKLR